MLQFKSYLNRRLTGLEMLAVGSGISLLIGLGCLVYNFVAAKALEVKVEAAIPKVLEDIRTQRAKLVSALEAYKVKFGTYPPDHVVSRSPLVVDAVTNMLLYELAGVMLDSTNNTVTVGRLERADAGFVKGFFNCDGFTNCAASEDKLERFLPVADLTVLQLHDDPDIYSLGFPLYSEEIDPNALYQMQVSSWRYVSTSPTNNPKTYDLWIELKTANRTIIIGNWDGAN